jgi:hypothetical protein
METRPLGDTGHDSSVLTFGGIVLDYLAPDRANDLVERTLDAGVNHFDVAPAYGDAEEKLGPKLREHRDEIFLGCKTVKRTREEARRRLERSLNRMGIDRVDLYQFHGVTTMEELDTITGDGGALEAYREAKDEGLVDHIGLTSHGEPGVILEAIDRIDDLATVMFPMNATVMGKDDAAHDYEAVLERAEEEGVGALGIKAFAKEPWPPEEKLRPFDRPYNTWYRPYDTQDEIDDCLNAALSRGMTSITNAGDPALVPMILDAAQRFEQLDEDERRAIVEERRDRESPVPAQLD